MAPSNEIMISPAPLVSICVPSFNAEHTIARCLGSVLGQDLSQAEIVVVDNCSTDRTCEVAATCLDGFPRTRIVRNPSNVGRVGNWNRCLDEARGTFIKYMFTNDVMMPGALAELLRSIVHDADVVMVASSALHVPAVPSLWTPVPSGATLHRRSSGETLDFFAKHGFRTGSLNGMIYRRAPIVERGLRFREDIPYFADFYQAVELAPSGATVFHDLPTFYFDESATGRYHFVGLQDPRRFFVEHRQCTELIAKLLREHGRSPQPAFQYLVERYFWYLGQGTKLTAQDAWHIFGGYAGLQLKMAARTFWFNRRKSSAVSRPDPVNLPQPGRTGQEVTGGKAI